jgi:hypothetical protein
LREISQSRAAAVQGGFRRSEADAQNFGRLDDGMAEHVDQRHACPLRRGQPQERGETRGRRDPRIGGGAGVCETVDFRLRSHRLLPFAAAQRVERAIMGDAEQPAFRLFDMGDRGQGFRGFGERLLHHVFAVERGADHARGITVQAWAKIPRQLAEGLKIQALLRHAVPLHVDFSIGESLANRTIGSGLKIRRR